jgi:hypothetical protein
MAGADEVRKMIRDAGGDKPVAATEPQKAATAGDLTRLRDVLDAQSELLRQIAEDVRWFRSWVFIGAVAWLTLTVIGLLGPLIFG